MSKFENILISHALIFNTFMIPKNIYITEQALLKLSQIFTNKWFPTMCDDVFRALGAYKLLISSAILNGFFNMQKLEHFLSCKTSFQSEEMDSSNEDSDESMDGNSFNSIEDNGVDIDQVYI